MKFYCLISGNLFFRFEWKFRGRKFILGFKYVVNDGVLIIKCLNYSDVGWYFCVVINIFGLYEGLGNLIV